MTLLQPAAQAPLPGFTALWCKGLLWTSPWVCAVGRVGQLCKFYRWGNAPHTGDTPYWRSPCSKRSVPSDWPGWGSHVARGSCRRSRENFSLEQWANLLLGPSPFHYRSLGFVVPVKYSGFWGPQFWDLTAKGCGVGGRSGPGLVTDWAESQQVADTSLSAWLAEGAGAADGESPGSPPEAAVQTSRWNWGEAENHWWDSGVSWHGGSWDMGVGVTLGPAWKDVTFSQGLCSSRPVGSGLRPCAPAGWTCCFRSLFSHLELSLWGLWCGRWQAGPAPLPSPRGVGSRWWLSRADICDGDALSIWKYKKDPKLVLTQAFW